MNTKGILGIIVILVLLAGGFLYYRAGQQEAALQENMDTTAPPQEEESQKTQAEKHIVKILSQNDSNEEGVASLVDYNGKVMVQLSVTNVPAGIPQPAHIHVGSCANPGSVKYPLENVVEGKSETTINISMADLLKSLPLAINVHKSAQQVGTYVACGDITADAAAIEIGAEDEMVTPPPAAGSEIKTFSITGKNFSFSQSEIQVKKGDKIRINFSSTSGFHDWAIDEFNAKTQQVSTGQSDAVEFVADKAGTFEYYCSVGTHRQMGMKGKLIVE